MGTTFSACASSCQNPTSPSESTTSFLIVPHQSGRTASSTTGGGPSDASTKPNFAAPQSDKLRAASTGPVTSSCAGDLASLPSGEGKSDYLWHPDDPIGVDSTTPYTDKFLQDLDDSMPPPPLPPRTYNKKKLAPGEVEEAGHGGECPSTAAEIERAALPRIYPIKQNGLKLSDTHYWVIPPRRHHSERQSRSAAGVQESYQNLPEEHHYSEEPTSHPGMTTLTPPECPLKRGRSENAKECLWNMQRGHVLRLIHQVPAASEQEAYVVLVGSNWNFDDAVKRLKVELLCRTGYALKNHCCFLLEKHNYDLDAATRQAKQEYRERLLLR